MDFSKFYQLPVLLNYKIMYSKLFYLYTTGPNDRNENIKTNEMNIKKILIRNNDNENYGNKTN